MEKYLVNYTNIKGEEITSEWFYSFENVQNFMSTLIGKSFSAKVMRFQGHKMNGLMNMICDTTNDFWVKK
jgi:hypothetical protein